MNFERHRFDIRNWTKDQIFEKIKEIFENEDAIRYIKAESDYLEYEVLRDPAKTGGYLKNPSKRQET